MAVTYTWVVTQLETINTPNLEDVVVVATWKKIGTDETGATGTYIGATPFKASSVTPGTFVPFDQLTQDIVVGWIQAVVINQYAVWVDAQIAAGITGTGVQTPPLPWVPPEPTPEPTPALAGDRSKTPVYSKI
jgi:hypothetical protein